MRRFMLSTSMASERLVDGELKHNLYGVIERIERASAVNGERVTLVAATKTVDAETVNAAVSLGVKNIGENRVREYLDKRDAVSGAEWHFIGTLQRNKAKYLVGNVSLIQSVSDELLAVEIDKLAARRGIKQRVLVELNAGDEPSKTGATTDRIDELIGAVKSMKNIELDGLMAMPPVNASDNVYAKIEKVFARHRDGTFRILSVGMSADFERAISHGSNMVRIGSAIFGNRKTKEVE